MRFTKMHGLGNDFMVVASGAAPPAAERIRALADRRTGVGFDQLLWVGPARDPANAACYRIFNSDGSEAEQCGNGARCIARLLATRGAADELVLEHAGGLSAARILGDGTVSVAMGEPDFRPEHVPFAAEAEAETYEVELDGETLALRVVSIGNPHGVVRVPDVASAPVARVGPALERHERFPNRANISFMQVVTSGHVQLRVFERGVGETRACGTGACAAAVVGQRAGWLDDSVRVDLPGGTVTVSWKGPGEPVWLTGEAITVFEGTVAA
ncbi:MAG: diaminopimelate epimerase [Chromatiales bacterium]|nr:MAG: diaminopimelate epimerase [Chromatiales bacterium]